MKNAKRRLLLRPTPLAALAACALLLPALPALADNITYTVDPTRSSLTLSGTYAGNALGAAPGVPGSLTTSYAGTIAAQRDFGANTLQISGGNVTAQTNGTSSPVGIGYGLGYSSPPADYGFTGGSGVTSPPSSTFLGALVNFAFSATSPVIDSPNSFDVSQFSTTITSGEVDYTFSGPGYSLGFLDLAGNLAFSPAMGTLADVGNAETVTIPIQAEITAVIGGQQLDVHLSGSILATANVPEPTSSALLGISTAVFLGCRVGRGRRRSHLLF